jgi:DNA repair ATPase RecN
MGNHQRKKKINPRWLKHHHEKIKTRKKERQMTKEQAIQSLNDLVSTKIAGASDSIKADFQPALDLIQAIDVSGDTTALTQQVADLTAQLATVSTHANDLQTALSADEVKLDDIKAKLTALLALLSAVQGA